jgi:exonuclease SbcC
MIPFVNGFNCLVGGLGQGKSSVLYAFDFVLFGDPIGRSYDYLLREDADKGKITATFVHNNKTYKIRRALKRRGDNISQDIDQLKLYRDGKLVASNKNDAVAEELKNLTGLDKNLFREVVWVRQEHLKELLDITPRQRQTKLDQLFELSDYEDAWSNLQSYYKMYDTEKGLLERDADVIRINKLDTDYSNAVEEFSSVSVQLETANDTVAQTEETLKDATARLESLEELRKTTEALQRTEVQLRTNIANIKRRHTELLDQQTANKKRLEELTKTLQQLKTQEKIHRKALQEIGWDDSKSLAELRSKLSGIEKQLTVLGGEEEATKREMRASANKISSIIAENRCPRCLQEVTGEYKQSLQDNLQKEQKESEKRLTELKQQLDELRNTQRKASAAISKLQQIVPRIGDIKSQTAERQEQITKFVEDTKNAQEEIKRLEEELSKTREEIANFDVSELNLARKLRDEAYNNHSDAVHELDNLKQQKTYLAKMVDELKERLDNAQLKIERKEKIGKLLEIIDRIRVAYRSIQPKLRGEFIKYLQITVQNVLDNLTGDTQPALNVSIDKTYSPHVSSEKGYSREVTNLSGGERTLLAFAYRIGLGQLIMQSRTGHGLYMLLLDEPTESLGREDGSVERLSEAVSRLKAIEQIIAVTHNEAFAEKAEHVIRIEKELGASQIQIER